MCWGMWIKSPREIIFSAPRLGLLLRMPETTRIVDESKEYIRNMSTDGRMVLAGDFLLRDSRSYGFTATTLGGLKHEQLDNVCLEDMELSEGEPKVRVVMRNGTLKLSSAETATVTDFAVTRIRTWVVAATTRSTNHYTITAMRAELIHGKLSQAERETIVRMLLMTIKIQFSSAETATVTDFAVTRIRTWVVAATTRSAHEYGLKQTTAVTYFDYGLRKRIISMKIKKTTLKRVIFPIKFQPPVYKSIHDKLTQSERETIVRISAETATVTDLAVTRIRTWVVAATTRSTNHYTITAVPTELI
ncbi:hypothetical protein DPMN_091425 [Dreissena polymorpha]|uniref:Uncharacterized protein n=1 Tax=Dreissena polymorpha TaxID=45954 RepID=A0A9D4L0I0_DREPO|nr:hypothetical protein DPMN_091425 [Dreissena polymorpha]